MTGLQELNRWWERTKLKVREGPKMMTELQEEDQRWEGTKLREKETRTPSIDSELVGENRAKGEGSSVDD
jgi:hypothetical protein